MLYFLPPQLADVLSVSPLWMARVCGALLLAWGGFLIAAGLQPDQSKIIALVSANLLLVATLLPALLKSAVLGGIQGMLWGVVAWLLVCALLALVGLGQLPTLSTKTEKTTKKTEEKI